MVEIFLSYNSMCGDSISASILSWWFLRLIGVLDARAERLLPIWDLPP